ncbi:MAG TPA: M43 family zinc metalloprotease [Puia sp.]|jgi:hypothetical protein|nr:M43 family zinc metalloprotease [Puia sp.]
MKNFLPFVGSLLITVSGWAQRDCRWLDYKQQQLKADPSLAEKVEAVESFTRMQLHRSSVTITGQGTGTKDIIPSLITIPVVVHIVYNSSSQNISDAQVLSQLDVLNADYGKHNADTSAIPSYYSSLAANSGFRFVLAGVDTDGHATTGIIHKYTNATSFSLNDNVKYSSRGGDDAWDRDRYLNIWVCNLNGDVLGYSSITGGSKETDGVVIRYTAFGTKGTATAPYNRGRTATHEIGHWLNLIHVWGDSDCGDDEVADTPPQSTATYGNPRGIIISCGNTPYGNLYMDYMDFTDDLGMHLFTYGQRDRMRSLFAEGGFRQPLLNSATGAVSTGSIGGGVTVPGTGEVVGVDLHPNPAMSTLSVNLQGMARIGGMLEVYNQVGMKVMAVRITALSFSLNLSRLTGGVYFVRTEGGGSSRFVKL